MFSPGGEFRVAICVSNVSYMLAFSAIQTESLPPSAAEQILNQQRLRRPSSPHFTIYQPQLTWLGSIAHRVFGSGLSVRTCLVSNQSSHFR